MVNREGVISWSDILRMLVIGQACWACVWALFTSYVALRKELRPGHILGIVFMTLGNTCALVAVIMYSHDRMGEEATFRTWLSAIAVISESLGYMFIASHLFWHDPELSRKLRSWFVHE